MFYTNAIMAGDDLLLIEINKGKRVFSRINSYKPYLFIPSSDPQSKYKTVFGKSMGRLDFDSIKEAKDYVKRYAGMAGHAIHGLQMFQYTMLNDKYSKEVNYDPDEISVVSLDIETDSRGGFPNIELADKEITAITLRKRGSNLSFGLLPFDPDPDTEYVRCRDERELLSKFIGAWNSDEWFPDVVTGWNVEFFDLPYLVNRIARELSLAEAKKLSPWRYLRPKKIQIGHRENNTYDITGINVLDYIQLYKKFSNTPQESYTLDFISEQELGEKKVDYKSLGYESLHDLYERNHQLFMEYNIQDAVLVEKLEAKMKLIELVWAMAYDAKINYADTLTTVRMWDVIIHNHLLTTDRVIPPMTNAHADRQIQGGYVKDPPPGRYECVVSFDFESLYPSLEEQHNISPETFVRKERVSVSAILNNTHTELLKMAKENDWAITGSGALFLKKVQGFLPELMTRLKAKRKAYKKKMFAAETAGDDNAYAKYDKAQQAVKIQINAAYGALANPYFRWFQPDLAEAVTLSGQLTTMWAEKQINAWLNKACKTVGHDYVIAADTDSCYICLDPIIKKMNPETDDDAIQIMDKFCSAYLQPAIEQCLKDLAKLTNVKASTLNMKRESLASVGIWSSKKHYVLKVHDKEGVKYDPPKVRIVGLEAIKSSIPVTCRKELKTCINTVLDGSVEDLRKQIAAYKEKFYKTDYESFAFPRGCNGINKYTDAQSLCIKHTPIHVRAAIVYNYWVVRNKLHNELPMVLDGEKIRYTYMLKPNPFDSHVMANLNRLPNYESLKQYIDLDTQFEKCFLGPLRTVTVANGWEIEEATTYTAEDFFN